MQYRRTFPKVLIFYLIPAALGGFWGCRLDYVTGNVALQNGEATPRDIDMSAPV